MAISEAQRTDLYTGLVEVFGPTRAEIMMSAYKLHDLDEVATKRDLAEFRAESRAELAEFRVEVRTELAEFRGELTGFRKDLDSGLKSVREEMATGFANLRAEFKSDFTHYSFILVASCLAIIATLIGIAVFN